MLINKFFSSRVRKFVEAVRGAPSDDNGIVYRCARTCVFQTVSSSQHRSTSDLAEIFRVSLLHLREKFRRKDERKRKLENKWHPNQGFQDIHPKMNIFSWRRVCFPGIYCPLERKSGGIHGPQFPVFAPETIRSKNSQIHL